MQQIDITELEVKPFQVYDKDWALLVTEVEGKANAMTISWGGLGTLWNMPVATSYVRLSRYTHDLIEQSDRFSLCWLDASEKRSLGLCGSVSGRDQDKITACNFEIKHASDGTPYIATSTRVLCCRKILATPLPLDAILDSSIAPTMYGDGDTHDIYIGEVTAAYIA